MKQKYYNAIFPVCYSNFLHSSIHLLRSILFQIKHIDHYVIQQRPFYLLENDMALCTGS